VEGGGGGLTVSGVSRNRGSFVKCVATQKRLGIPGLEVNAERIKYPMFMDRLQNAGQYHNKR
jgi:hypothetical protein